MNSTYDKYINILKRYAKEHNLSMKVTPLQDGIVLAEVRGSYIFLMREKKSYVLSHRENALSLNGDESFSSFEEKFDSVLGG